MQSLRLTARQGELASLLDSDLTLPRIASKLFISVNTVKTELRQLYRRLGVESRSQAVAHLRLAGLDVTPPPSGEGPDGVTPA